MLQKISDLYGHKLMGIDRAIGHVKDFYFDDKVWAVRYLVADTGSWLSGRLVLISPHAFAKWDQFEKILHIKLTEKQIQNSPAIESHKPVSRQYEADYHHYYGWPAYWNAGAIFGLGGPAVILPESKAEMEASQLPPRDDRHLQSARDITGYRIQATDELIGSVNGFTVDDRSWMISDLVVETGHWYSGKELNIPTRHVQRISHDESKVYVSLTKADLVPAEKKIQVKAEPESSDAENVPDTAPLRTASAAAAPGLLLPTFNDTLSGLTE